MENAWKWGDSGWHHHLLPGIHPCSGFWNARHAETSEGSRNTGNTRNVRMPFHITSQHHLTYTWSLCRKKFFCFWQKNKNQTKNVKSNTPRAPKKIVFFSWLITCCEATDSKIKGKKPWNSDVVPQESWRVTHPSFLCANLALRFQNRISYIINTHF